ncbi:MAG TPA: SEC-C domain-containing protein [Candidatus Sulfomarinibacteraceae bacterium]|nr:SEC-C domain-containing protein [Candidatus Sulfomarinibacteraceae bacterium]
MSRRPGRNEPCYCGSGLKYKKCHMRADLEADRQRREALEAARFLRRDLISFARDERFAPSFGQALPVYWNGYYTIENAEEMSESEALRFFDWFAFDYEGGEGQERLLDVYRQECWDDLSSRQQAVLAQWQESVGPAGAYILVEYEGQTLRLQDFLSAATVEVYEAAGHGDAQPGDLILGRLLPVHDHLELSSAAAYIPQDEIADLPQKLEEAAAAFREAHPDASADDFLRRHNHLFVHHALEQAEKNGRAPVARLRDE